GPDVDGRLHSTQHEATAALWVHAADTQSPPPAPHGVAADTPPVADGRSRFMPESASQFLIDQDPKGTCTPIRQVAARPGDRRIGPGPNEHSAIAVQAECPVAPLQGRGRVRSE